MQICCGMVVSCSLRDTEYVKILCLSSCGLRGRYRIPSIGDWFCQIKGNTSPCMFPVIYSLSTRSIAFFYKSNKMSNKFVWWSFLQSEPSSFWVQKCPNTGNLYQYLCKLNQTKWSGFISYLYRDYPFMLRSTISFFLIVWIEYWRDFMHILCVFMLHVQLWKFRFTTSERSQIK